MKKVNFKNVMMTLVVTLAFLFVGVQDTNAQVSNDAELSVIFQGNYVTAGEAQVLLEEELAILKDLLETLSAGVPFNVTLRKYIYFSGIQTELLGGKSIPQSIVNGFGYLNDSNGNGNLLPPQLNQLRNDAIAALSN